VIKKYNLALLPMNHRQSVIELSSTFASIAGSYQLGEHSLPHVTLCKFFAEEQQLAAIWELVSVVVSEPLKLSFREFSYIKLKSQYWISVLPTESDALHVLHYKLHQLVHPGKLKQSYDPHMTLVNLSDDSYPYLLETLKADFSDSFCLAMGANDEVGQFVKVIFSQ
jgi:2'-5' RNA ligase